MENLNENIEIIAVEAIAQSRFLLVNKDIQGLCLTVITEDVNVEVQDKTYAIENVIGFNAFKEFETQEEKDDVKLILSRKLSDENIKKINSILG